MSRAFYKGNFVLLKSCLKSVNVVKSKETKLAHLYAQPIIYSILNYYYDKHIFDRVGNSSGNLRFTAIYFDL
jgi:hypothetical protein